MDAPEQPQIYLITPPALDLDGFPDVLAQVLDQVPVACVRLALATRDQDTVSRTADALREVTHARDVALVIGDHVMMVERLGLDGVHLSDAARSVRAARKELGAEAIVGSFCAASQHDGISAGEAGADYISFGPVTASPLGDGAVADMDLFSWWSEMIELPVVAEGGLDTAAMARLAPLTDFFGIGDEIWATENPAQALRDLCAAMG